jgi:hypothetical protein
VRGHARRLIRGPHHLRIAVSVQFWQIGVVMVPRSQPCPRFDEARPSPMSVITSQQERLRLLGPRDSVPASLIRQGLH